MSQVKNTRSSRFLQALRAIAFQQGNVEQPGKDDPMLKKEKRKDF